MAASNRPRTHGTDVRARGVSRPGTGAARSTRGKRAGSARSRSPRTPPRRKVLLRRWVAALSVAVALGLAYVLLFTSLFGVSSVRVIGTHGVVDERVRDAASVQQDQPLVRVDTGAVRRRVGELPALAAVEVSRSWPSTIVIRVHERTPVAVIGKGEKYRLLDGSGIVFRTVSEKPKGLPELTSPGSGERSTHAAATVAAALPDQLRGRAATISAETPHSVRLKLDDDTTVIWGSSERSARKAKVLAALMSRPGSVYDVSSPELPTIR